MRLYLDLCCFNRPFDDQSQILVRLQTEAKLMVQEQISSGRHELIWSAILDLENDRNPDVERMKAVSAWKSLAMADLDTTDAIEQIATNLQRQGLKAMDALHLASAIEAKVDRFLTVDHAILRKMKNDQRILVIDPIDLIREQEEKDHEE